MKNANHIIDEEIFPPNDSDEEMELQDHAERIMEIYNEWAKDSIPRIMANKDELIKKAVPRIPDGDGVAACGKRDKTRIDVPPIF